MGKSDTIAVLPQAYGLWAVNGYNSCGINRTELWTMIGRGEYYMVWWVMMPNASIMTLYYAKFPLSHLKTKFQRACLLCVFVGIVRMFEWNFKCTRLTFPFFLTKMKNNLRELTLILRTSPKNYDFRRKTAIPDDAYKTPTPERDPWRQQRAGYVVLSTNIPIACACMFLPVVDTGGRFCTWVEDFYRLHVI